MAFLRDIPVALGKVRYTATLIIGRYAFWLVKRPHILESLLNYVTQGLADPQVSSPSPVSMLSVGHTHHVWLILGGGRYPRPRPWL